MATARAQQRGGGVTAIHVALIAFVALWLVCTVLLVWLYTDQSTLNKQADDLRASEQTAQQNLRRANGDRDRMAELVSGSADDDGAAIEGKINDLYERIRSDDLVSEASAFDDDSAGLLNAMTTLYQAHRGEHEARTAAEERADSLAGEVASLTAERAALQESFAATEERLTAQVQELEDDRSRYRSERDEEIDQVDERIEQQRQQFSADIQNQRNDNARLKQELDDLKNRYHDLQAKLGELQITPEPLLTTRQGDGRVLMARPGDDVVYINLGHRHHLTRGMQFAVYSDSESIPANGLAKARIEVARIFEETAECTIREVLGNEAILEGDIINNPVYDKSRTLRFVVAGMFDLDGDGILEGQDRIAALIREWGGEVADTVSARVDFVVLGNPPRKPSTDAGDGSEESEREVLRRRVFENYTQAFEAAQTLSVPVLTQDKFLHFLGYADRLAY